MLILFSQLCVKVLHDRTLILGNSKLFCNRLRHECLAAGAIQGNEETKSNRWCKSPIKGQNEIMVIIVNKK